MAFDNIKDASVRKLAETLRESGLASSDTQAISMAEDMSSTAKKVQKDYDEQDAEYEVTLTSTKEIVERVEKQDIELAPDKEDSNLRETTIPSEKETEDLYKEQEAVIKSSYGSGYSSQSATDNIEESTEINVDDFSHAEPESQKPISQSEAPTVEEPAKQEVSSVSSHETGDGYEVDKTVELEPEKKSEEERDEDVESMAESKIDLSDVFSFGNK